MSSHEYAAPLRLELKASRRLAALVALVHGGALGLLALVPWSTAVRLPLAGAILVSLGAVCSRHFLGRAVRGLIWQRDGGWVLLTSGTALHCRLRPGSYVHPYCTVLNFEGDARRSVLLFTDNVDAEQFRRLRVRLGLEGR